MLIRNTKLCIIALFLALSLITQAESTTILENKTSQLENTTTNELVDWQTYQDDKDGYKIQYPQEWNIEEPEHLVPERGFTVNPQDDGVTEVSVDVENASRTLDPATLKIQLLPLEHYANRLIAGLTSILEGSSADILTNEAVTFSGEPAWRVDHIFNYKGSQLLYGSTILVIKDDKLYEIAFLTNPFKVEEMRPIGEKIIQTFQFFNNTGSEEPLAQSGKTKPLESKNAQSNSDCEESYPNVCITADMECSDVLERNFEVRGSDPNNFDLDGDGIGCEE